MDWECAFHPNPQQVTCQRDGCAHCRAQQLPTTAGPGVPLGLLPHIPEGRGPAPGGLNHTHFLYSSFFCYYYHFKFPNDKISFYFLKLYFVGKYTSSTILTILKGTGQ